MTQLAQDLVVTKWCSISPDKDDDRSKRFKIELVIPVGTTITDLANTTLSTYVIKFQNTKRPKWDKLVDNSTHRITYKRPISEVDPMTALLNEAKASGIDVTDTDALTVYIMSKLTK